MIFTSYFAKMKAIKAADPNAVFIAICGGLPEWYEGSWYRKVAPKWKWWKWWHDTYAGHYETKEAADYYTACYKNTVLSALSREKVLSEIEQIADRSNAYLLCYEAPNKFCHRQLLAAWLNENTENKIVEWRQENENQN